MRPLLLLLGLGLAACAARGPQAVDGLVDLRDHDFATDGAVLLRGDWQLFWNELVPPSSEARSDDALPIRKWNGLRLVDGRTLPGQGYATYRLKLLLPDREDGYTLFVDPIIDACRFWVTSADGKTLGPIDEGQVGTTADTSHGSLTPASLRFRAAGEVTVTLQVSNFAHARGGSGAPPLFGTDEAVESYLSHQRMADFFYIGLLVIMALHHLWSFLLHRREQAALWLALLCLLIALRALLLGRYLQLEWPSTPLWLLCKVEYLTLYLALPAGLLFLRRLFPRDVSRPLTRACVAVSLAFVVTLVLPRPMYSALAPLYQLLLVVAFVVGTSMLVRASMRERDLPPMIVLVGFLALGVAVLLDILRERSIVHMRFVAHYGVSAFVLFQSALLALLNQRRERLLEQRNREVQRLNDELGLLNDELKRQIAHRSQELQQLLLRAAKKLDARPPALGEIVGERYRLVSLVGAGGMGTVYRAERLADGKPVALKLMHGDAGADVFARFAREAEVVAGLDHPNIIGILDFGVSDGGMIYLVMDLVEGRSLEEERERFGDVPWALPLLRQLAEALTAIHAREVIHRDVKPANLLVSDGRLKLADFGVAHVQRLREVSTTAVETVPDGVLPIDSSEATLTRAGMMIGSPMYMAPELAGGAEFASTRSDVFSFGLVAYEMLTGQRAFPRPLLQARLENTELPELVPLQRIKPDLDGRLATLVESCLQVTPEARPTAKMIRELLSRLP